MSDEESISLSCHVQILLLGAFLLFRRLGKKALVVIGIVELNLVGLGLVVPDGGVEATSMWGHLLSSRLGRGSLQSLNICTT